MPSPDDGKERWLIAGELREKEITRRNFGHSRIEAKIAHLLHSWVAKRPEPRGVVIVGTIAVYRGDAEPELYNVTQTLSGEPHLPGFEVSVKDVFSR